MNIKIKNSIFVCLLFLLGVIYFPVKVSAQNDVKVATPTIDPLIQEVKDQYQFLSNQATSFSADVKEERKNYLNFVERLFLILSGVLGGIFAIFQFLGYKEIKKAIKNANKKVETKHEVMLQRIVDKKVATLKSLIDKEVSYRQSKILLLSDSDSSYDPKIIDVLNKKGFDPIFGKSDYNDFTDITAIIYHYTVQDGKEDNNLEKLIDKLRLAVEYPIPLIIYATGKPIGRDNTTSEKLDSYCWYTFSNTPVTLINSIFLVANTFYDLKK